MATLRSITLRAARLQQATFRSSLRTHRQIVRLRCDSAKPGPAKTPAKAPQARSKPAGSPLGWASLGLSALVGGAMLIFYKSEKERLLRERTEKVHGTGMPMIGGSFELIDGDGKQRQSDEFLGKFTLVYFGFTHCPDICPAELTKMASALKILDAMADVGPDLIQPLFITIDPKRDTPSQIKSYAKEFSDRLLPLTGSDEEIKSICKKYRVYYSAPEDADEDYLVDHSIIIYLMGKNGAFCKFFGQSSTVEEMVQEIHETVTTSD